MLFRKKIILGVTGSIAAYKSAMLTRLLVKAGAEVRVVMTDSAKDFITPLTLSTLSKNQVHSAFTLGSQGDWVNHVELGLWADAIIIAPASANILSVCANGACKNLMAAIYLSARCPVFFAPAMDVDMWKHPATRSNVRTLKNFGNHFIEPNNGELASGLIGEGRMSEPEEIVHVLQTHFSSLHQMKGKKIMITAGPTREAIDPVRYISNYSSGKMGYQLATELAFRGAEITLISGPVDIEVANPAIHLIKVNSAEQMYNASLAEFQGKDAAILTAAVADFRPENTASGKIKKTNAPGHISLILTQDILSALGKVKKPQQLLAGFALETAEGRLNAETKLKNKNLDFIVLNELSGDNEVFGSDFNEISIFSEKKQWKSFEKKTKTEAAADIADYLNELFKNA